MSLLPGSQGLRSRSSARGRGQQCWCGQLVRGVAGSIMWCGVHACHQMGGCCLHPSTGQKLGCTMAWRTRHTAVRAMRPRRRAPATWPAAGLCMHAERLKCSGVCSEPDDRTQAMPAAHLQTRSPLPTCPQQRCTGWRRRAAPGLGTSAQTPTEAVGSGTLAGSSPALCCDHVLLLATGTAWPARAGTTCKRAVHTHMPGSCSGCQAPSEPALPPPHPPGWCT